MVHIDPATLWKYPIIGVMIGGTTAAVLCYLLCRRQSVVCA